MTNRTRIENHTFHQTAGESVRPYVLKIKRGEPQPEPSKSEQYRVDVFLSSGNVVNCIEQLHFCVGMLTGFRAPRVPKNMTRHDYIVFGIENYYLRVTSVYDRCLRLVNALYELGIPERSCNDQTITKNLHVRSTPVEASLKELNKFTEHFRPHRNSVTHHATYRDDVLDRLGRYYAYLHNPQTLPEERFKHICKTLTDKYVSDRQDEFQQKLHELEKLVETLFDALQPVFTRKLSLHTI